MSDMTAHHTMDDEDLGRVIASIHPASARSVNEVISADPKSDDGRSPWMWIRLPNGDLILGVFPQGDTYSRMEADSQYPGA